MKPHDASLNALIDAGPADWVRLLAPRVGLTPGPSEPVDTDLSVTAQSDKAFLLTGPPAAILHVELEGGSRLGIPGRLLRYNVLLGYNREEPVYSVVVLLRPGAGGSDLTGVFARPNLEFRYAVVKVWEESVDALVSFGPATTGLAVLTDESVADPAGVVDRVVARLRQPDVDGKLAAEVLGQTYFLSGARHDRDFIKTLFARYGMLYEYSTTYQDTLEQGREQGRKQGRVDEARRLLQLQARKRFGTSPPAEAVLAGIADTARLERIAERVLDAAGWDDLLATP